MNISHIHKNIHIHIHVHVLILIIHIQTKMQIYTAIHIHTYRASRGHRGAETRYIHEPKLYSTNCNSPYTTALGLHYCANLRCVAAGKRQKQCSPSAVNFTARSNSPYTTLSQCSPLLREPQVCCSGQKCRYIAIHMGWLRLLVSLKLQVSFAKESHKRDDILQKRLIILRSLLIVATPQLYIYYARANYRSLLQNIVSFIGLFCKRNL